MTFYRAILGLKAIYPTAWCKFMGLLTKTGQVTSYEDYDDGYYQLGLSPDLVPLTTGQYSGTTNITVFAKTIGLSNECVQDNRSGKMWARYVPQEIIGPGNDGLLLWKDATNSEDIFEFCKQANIAGLGEHSDWRVPNFRELSSLADLGKFNPAIDAAAFPSTPADFQFTSTTDKSNMLNCRVVSFAYGHSSSVVKTTAKYYCRLVRG